MMRIGRAGYACPEPPELLSKDEVLCADTSVVPAHAVVISDNKSRLRICFLYPIARFIIQRLTLL
jgi:hypothetical protein